jgi:hypothetical protein
MNNSDNQNDGPGFIAIIIIIILASIGLYYFFSHRPPTALNVDDNPDGPLQPSPQLNDNVGENTFSNQIIVKKMG